MHITHVNLQGIPFLAPNTSLDFPSEGKQWTLILGDMGTGKTSILWYIASFFLNPSCVMGSLSPFKTKPSDLTLSGNPPRFFAYGASRRINKMPHKEFEASGGYETLYSDQMGLPSVSRWLVDAHILKNLKDSSGEGRARASMKYDTFISLLKGITPSVSDVQLKAFEGRPAVMFTTDLGERSFDTMPQGYRTEAAMVIDLASHMFQAYPDSADPLTEKAVVLIDEIELHQHPKQQREMLRFLTDRFPAVQFIVTTQSPVVVQALSDANIVVLKKVGNHVEIENDPVSVKTWRVDQILSSELFGLEGVRPPGVEVKRARLEKLLLLDNRTAEQEAELARLDAELDEIAMGYNAEHIEALDFLKRVADEMKDTAQTEKVKQ